MEEYEKPRMEIIEIEEELRTSCNPDLCGNDFIIPCDHIVAGECTSCFQGNTTSTS